MIARGFRSLVWVAMMGLAALGCYMLSLQVAAERSELAQLDRRIQTTRANIRALQTELGTRGRLQQLEEWNAEVLALSAPAANQFVDSAVRLARFDTRTPPLADRPAEVRLASAETSTQPRSTGLASSTSPVRLAVATAPALSVAGTPMVHRASFELVPAASATPPASTAPAAPPRPRPRERLANAGGDHDRPATRAGGGLLDEETLRAITRAARAEHREGARD